MNIGFDFRMGGSRNAGIGRYAFELLSHILQLDAKNTYSVFYRPDTVSEEDLEVLKRFEQVELLPVFSRHYSLSEQTVFLRQLQRTRCDIVHFPNFNVPVLYRRPYVVTIHDLAHHKISGHKKSRWVHFHAYKYIIQHASRSARRIITISQAAKREIVELLGAPQEKVHVIYEAGTLQQQDPEAVVAVKKKFLLTRPYFLFVGTLERKKNVVNLSRAFDLFINHTQLDMDLVFAGKVDPHYPLIKHQALDILHKDRLVFTGYIPDSDLAALYRGAYAFISASLHEGFGLPGVEAMSFGIPLLVSNTPVFNEIYDNAALYFDPENLESIAKTMEIVSTDARFHIEQQQKSFARSQLFNWRKTAQETLAVYNTSL